MWVSPPPQYRRTGYWLLFGVLAFTVIAYAHFSDPHTDESALAQATTATLQRTAYHDGSQEHRDFPNVLPEKPQPHDADLATTSPVADHKTPAWKGIEWTDISVSDGDNLSLIFNRLGLNPAALHEIMSLKQDTAILKQLRPGQRVSFKIEDGQLHALRFEFDLVKTLIVIRDKDTFISEIITTELETQVKQSTAVIHDSLFLSGQSAGLSDKLIMQLVEIYGWDIDFALDIRRGDSFKVVYEEQYKGRGKVADGPILAAEFVNKNNTIRAVRYQRDEGEAHYYTDAGFSMRKTFLRTPLKFSRISSRFNLKRRHPILNKIRAHKGVDYAAPTGTPVKVTGDGVIHYVGRKGGYGKTIIVKHGGKYSTLYAHLSQYGKGMRRGRAVKQGQIIGYVGKSGLATGPHLHYEFRVHDIHRNPLTVELPQAESIPKEELADFKARTDHLFALLAPNQPVIAEKTRPIDNTSFTQADENPLKSHLW